MLQIHKKKSLNTIKEKVLKKKVRNQLSILLLIILLLIILVLIILLVILVIDITEIVQKDSLMTGRTTTQLRRQRTDGDDGSNFYSKRKRSDKIRKLHEESNRKIY